MTEEWKPIIIEKNGVIYDYTGLYEVSNKNNVRSLNYNRTGRVQELKQVKNGRGYPTVRLSKDGKSKNFTVHRLVATMFIPNPHNYTVVNHINEDKTDNRIENLEWCSLEYNTSYSQKGRTKKGKRKCRKIICVETGQIFNSVDEVVTELKRNFTEDMKYGCQAISKWIISECCRKKQPMLYNFKDYHFMYLDDYQNQ